MEPVKPIKLEPPTMPTVATPRPSSVSDPFWTSQMTRTLADEPGQSSEGSP